MPSTVDDIEKLRILTAENRFREGLRWLSDFERVDWNEVRDFVSSYVLPGPEPDYPEYRAFMLIAKEGERIHKKPFEYPDLADQLRFEMSRKFSALDSLSVLGAIVTPNDQGNAMPWSMLSPNYFLLPFENEGGFLTITGKPRTGKTCIACLIAEYWGTKYPGAEVLTNIPLKHECPGIRQVSTMTELLYGIADALEMERRWLWEFDEAGLAWLKTDAIKTGPRGLDKFSRIVPKLGGSLIVIEQRIEGISTTISDFTMSHIYCERPGFALADLPSHKTAIRAIPKPKVFLYRPGETGYFEVDINMDKFLEAFKFVADAGAKTQAERIRDFLKEEARLKEKPRDEKTGLFTKKKD